MAKLVYFERIPVVIKLCTTQIVAEKPKLKESAQLKSVGETVHRRLIILINWAKSLFFN